MFIIWYYSIVYFSQNIVMICLDLHCIIYNIGDEKWLKPMIKLTKVCF